jgi:hypothetical protein
VVGSRRHAGGRKREPDVGFPIVLRDAYAFRVEEAEVILGFGLLLVCRPAQPLGRLAGVPGDTVAVCIQDTEIILRASKPLLRCPPEPLSRLGRIARYPPTFVIPHAQIVLRCHVALRGGPAKPLGRRAIVLRHAISLGVQRAQEELGARITLLRQGQPYARGSGIVPILIGLYPLLKPRPPWHGRQPEEQCHAPERGEESLLHRYGPHRPSLL